MIPRSLRAPVWTLVGLAALTFVAAATDSPAPSATDARAIAVADQVMDALGGKAAWDATRFLRFDFAVEAGGAARPPRKHWWDKQTGRYRVEGRTKEGDDYIVLMNVNTKQGSAYVKGVQAQGEEEKKFLDRGYGAWTNDTYWLLMPYKLRDPGVVLRYDGQDKGQDKTWDKLALSFEGVGLTPKDRYWVYVDAGSHLVDRWEFILQDQKPEGPPTRFEWSGWKKFGPIMLAADRMNEKDKTRIYFPTLDVPANVPDTVFTSSTAVAAQ
jgi:hypothetical protein